MFPQSRRQKACRIPACAGMTVLFCLLSTVCCLLAAAPAHAQYKFNRSGHTATIDQSAGDTTLTQDSAETMVIDGTGRASVPGGVDIAASATCASAADAGTIRFNATANLVSTSNLVGHWRLDETSGTTAVNSINPGTHNGAMQGGMSASNDSVDGPALLALDFDGGNDYISVPTNAALKPTTNFTVAGWVYLRDNTDRAIIAAPDSDGWTTGWRVTVDATPSFSFVTNTAAGGAARVILTTTALNPVANAWYHIAGTYDGTNMNFYVNGVLKGASAQTGSIFYTGSSSLLIGSASGVTVLDGQMDDVRLYSRVLSPAEIENLYYYAGSDAALQVCDGSGWVTLKNAH